MPKTVRKNPLALLLMAATMATVAVLLVSCKGNVESGKPPTPAPAPPVIPVVDVRDTNRALTDVELKAYAGDAACASCHEAICTMQSASRHARTLKAVTVAEHGPYFGLGTKIKDPLLGLEYAVGKQDKACFMAGRGGNADGGILQADYVLGSGRNAHTFMSRMTDDTWIDLRLSYYTSARKWDYTPMQKPGDRQFTSTAGIEQVGERLVNCLLCHATTLRASGSGVDAERSHFGVGCERCHGPAQAHVDSARRGGNKKGADIVHLENLKSVSQDRINEVCGACHRTPKNAKPGLAVTENGIARFEGAALARSACYLKSKTLSCVTCHDPHGDADPSPAHNDAKCLSCHAGSGHIASKQEPAPSKVCPVNQKSGCVKCHMPGQRIKTIPYAVYHNHWIKVWPKQSEQ